MDPVGRFLWLPWARAQVRGPLRSAAGHLAYLEGEHDGYRRLRAPVACRRAVVQLGPESWLVVDDLRSRLAHTYRLHWLLPDWPHRWDADSGRLALDSPEGPYEVQVLAFDGTGERSLVRADPASPRGWQAPYYGHREPALSLDLTRTAPVARFLSLCGPQPCELVRDGDRLQVTADGWRATVHFGRDRWQDRRRSLVAAIELDGSLQDRLEPCTFC
jgi:hypothetical protein